MQIFFDGAFMPDFSIFLAILFRVQRKGTSTDANSITLVSVKIILVGNCTNWVRF